MSEVKVLTTGQVAARLKVPGWLVSQVFKRGLIAEPPRAGTFRLIPASMVPVIEQTLRELGYPKPPRRRKPGKWARRVPAKPVGV
jgi:hypothetical protein